MDPLESLPLERLRRRTSVKWRRFPDDVLPLWVAEMDATLAPAVTRALRAAIDAGDVGYAAGEGYLEAVAAFAGRRWGWELPVGRARLVPDVMRGVHEVLRVVTEPGAPVLVNPPVYPPFYDVVRHAGRTVVEVPLTGSGRLDLDALDAAMAAGAGRAAYLLCSPHNPHGTVHGHDELVRVAALARRHGIRVVSDEIHAPLVLPGTPFVPYLTVPGGEDAIALLSASKGWNLPGAKAAVAVAGADAVENLATIPEVVSHGVSHLGVLAHTAALRDGGDWLDALLAAILARRTLLADLLSDQLPGIDWTPGEATYLAWLDGRPLGLDVRPADHFLTKARVALLPGEEFGTGGAGHVRLNFATSTAILTDAVERMAASLP
ncbi:MalY/PatB family protein [Egicoccus sp. AB-alg6-2]|uniref:MalY/PatB family protein n=1 Tax=Egicoccus sp. AB-alg6-2 TaxID=3242692 RepID=UPI00359E6E4D